MNLPARLARDGIHVDDVVDHDVVGDLRRADIFGAADDVAVFGNIVDDIHLQVRGEEALRRHGNPVIIRNVAVIDVDRDLDTRLEDRRQRRPDHIVIAAPPAHPGRRPALARHPVPADVVGIAPAAIVIGGPAEGLVRHPGPAIEPRIDPVPLGIGPPVVAHAAGDEDILAAVVHPVAIGAELVIEDADAEVDVGPGAGDEAGRAALGRCRERQEPKSGAGHDGLEFHGICPSVGLWTFSDNNVP